MHVSSREAQSILTPQRVGFLVSEPFPFTHTLSAYTGCGFGATTCGLYCYAQFMPNWQFAFADTVWGTAVQAKSNAPELLNAALQRMSSARRRRLRIFMSSTTDPYQPIEAQYQLTRRCLEVFAAYDDLDLLVIQTRSPLVTRDYDLIAQIPYAWLSMTIETDDQALLRGMRGGPALAKRFAAIQAAREQGIHAQITVSPCLPHTEAFADRLFASGAERFVVDTCVDGDGSGGQRTARSSYPQHNPAWNDQQAPKRLFDRLTALGATVGWSAAGFCGIAPRSLLF
jgi:DNA repair photolyase